MTSTSTAADATDAELIYLHPDELHIGANVRDLPVVDDGFKASIKDLGVQQAITAYRDGEGRIVVRDGQRRTLAARAVGSSRVPVMVAAASEIPADDKAREIARITHQYRLNKDREGLTTRQDAKAITELLDLGVTPKQVTAKLGVDRPTVDAAPKASRSQRACDALDAGMFTLEQAAAMVEFEDDERAVELLARDARHGRFEHTLANLRTRKEQRARRHAAAKPFLDKGFTLLDERPYQLLQTGMQRLSWMTKQDGEQVTPDDIADPTKWAIWLTDYAAVVDKATGEEVDESLVDWELPDDEQPEEGMRHPNTVEEAERWNVEYFCTDLESTGFTGRSLDDVPAIGQLSEEQQEAKREAELADKRRTLRNNSAAKAATEVRTAWLKNTLLARKTPPKNASVWVATQLAMDARVVTEYRTSSTAAELLGIDEAKLSNGSAVASVSEARAQVITLGLVLGGYEARLRKFGWKVNDHYLPTHCDEYLRFLRGLGYSLAEIEEVVTGDRDKDSVALPE